MVGAVIENAFTEILNLSISASWLILAVIIIRAFMKKSPKSLRYILWAFVAVRLLCPFSIESTWSLVPSIAIQAPLHEEDMYLDSVVVEDEEKLGISENELSGTIENQQNDLQNMESEGTNKDTGDTNVEVLPDEVVDIPLVDATASRVTMQAIYSVVADIWILGMIVFLFSSVISVIRLKKKVGASLKIQENVWMCDEIQSPFILGVMSPHIYVPSFITEEQIPSILAHEREHLKYRDHWWKPFGFAILTLHWFNPLVWVAYILLCRDMELACDERVIQHMNEEEKKQYSKSLLLCNNPRIWISACPVAFGEIGVKERVKSILDYKKPTTWLIGGGVFVCIIVAVCFMTNPETITLDLDVDAIAKIELRNGMNGKSIEITDEDIIYHITSKINKLEFQKKGSTAGHGGWSYWLIWYDAQGNEMESFTTVGDNRIARDDYFYQATNGTLDKDYYKALLQGIAGKDDSDESDSTQGQVVGNETKPFGVASTPLTKEELEWFTTEFFNSEDNHMPNMFLSSEYDCPENINLNNLFYGGADGRGGGAITEEEKQLLLQQYFAEELLDVSRTTAEEMDAILMKYTKLTLENTNKIGLDALYYLPEYDAYYNVAGDTEYRRCDAQAGWRCADGAIVLEYENFYNGEDMLYHVTLKEENGNYYFVSNIPLGKDIRVYSKDEVLAMQHHTSGEYFFTEDIGYMVTDNGKRYSFLYRTEDGGKTWRAQMIYIPGAWYRCVNGLSIENGVLKIEVVLDEGSLQYEYTTDDMGRTWKFKWEIRATNLHPSASSDGETISYNGKQYQKSKLCNATLQWLELSEHERMLSSYFPPEFVVFEEEWGVTFTAKNITKTSLTLKCTQSGGTPTGELQTGSWYVVEMWTQEYGWKQLDYLPQAYELAWTQEAWMIPMENTCEWEVNWKGLYGELPSGKYRIGKEITDFRSTGDYDTAIYYAEFEIVE